MDPIEIYVDTQEPITILDELEEARQFFPDLNANIIRKSLEIGDYMNSTNKLGERKTWKDMQASKIDGRSEEQLPPFLKEAENGFHLFLLLEGSENDIEFWKRKSTKGKINVYAEKGVRIIQTVDRKHSAKWLLRILGHPVEMNIIHVPKITIDTSRSPVWNMYRCFPKVRNVRAELLFNEYQYLEDIVGASEDEIKATLGIKATTQSKIVENIMRCIRRSDE